MIACCGQAGAGLLCGSEMLISGDAASTSSLLYLFRRVIPRAAVSARPGYLPDRLVNSLRGSMPRLSPAVRNRRREAGSLSLPLSISAFLLLSSLCSLVALDAAIKCSHYPSNVGVTSCYTHFADLLLLYRFIII